MSRFYQTCAIDYPNGVPHLGHAYERFGADAIARYRRLRGDEVYFLVGTDEHAQKVAQEAEKAGEPPHQYVDRLAKVFQDTWDRLDISYDVFYRTTSPQHIEGVHALIDRIYLRSPDDLYEGTYEGYYCVGCEYFKRDADLVDGRCPLHPGRELEWRVEHNWFFRLSRYREFLHRYISEHEQFVQPASRRNEMLAILDGGLEDIAVSRGRAQWGIPWPRPHSSGEPQVVWVWLDALPNYLTATGYPHKGWQQRWPAQLHIVGKDINRLHTLIWPAFLEAAGLPLPERVWVHGFALFKGEKLSKSSGTAFGLDDAIDRHGADALRYFLLREIPWDTDGSYTWERFDERYNADLADALGNLASRVLAMLERYRQGVVPAAGRTELDEAADAATAEYVQAMDALLLHRGAQAAWSLVTAANVFVDRRAPWNLAKAGDHAGLDATLHALAAALVRICVLASPFLPRATRTLWEALGMGDPDIAPMTWKHVTDPTAQGRSTRKISPLFPKPVPS